MGRMEFPQKAVRGRRGLRRRPLQVGDYRILQPSAEGCRGFRRRLPQVPQKAPARHWPYLNAAFRRRLPWGNAEFRRSLSRVPQKVAAESAEGSSEPLPCSPASVCGTSRPNQYFRKLRHSLTGRCVLSGDAHVVCCLEGIWEKLISCWGPGGLAVCRQSCKEGLPRYCPALSESCCLRRRRCEADRPEHNIAACAYISNCCIRKSSFLLPYRMQPCSSVLLGPLLVLHEWRRFTRPARSLACVI